MYDFSVDYIITDSSNIINIHEYLMKKTQYKIILVLIKKMSIGLLIRIVSVSNHRRCLSLSNQKCKTQPSVINLHLNEFSQKLRYYSFAINLGICVGILNTLNDLPNRVCVPNETEDLNLSIFNMITGINA